MAYNPDSHVRNNLTATTDPTVNDDDTLNYDENSVWLNTTTDEVFYCADPTTGAAVWLNLIVGKAVSAAMLTKSTDQTSINGSATVTWDGTGYDINSIADLVNDGIRANEKGIWLVTCNLRCQSLGPGEWTRIFPKIDGVDPSDVGGPVSWNMGIREFSTSGIIGTGNFQLVTNNLITVDVSSSDTDFTVLSSSNGTYLNALYLGPDS